MSMTSANGASNREPSLGWRQTNRVSSHKLIEYIQFLEVACRNEPRSADLRTCLGIAQATNDDMWKSIESFEVAIGLDGGHFFARFKYAELLLRLGLRECAGDQTSKALELATTNWQVCMARRQLEEIWHLIRERNQ